MDKWQLLSIADNAELVVSELVTNAIKATDLTRPSAPRPELHNRLEMVCLCIYQITNELLIEVWDSQRQAAPERRQAASEDEGGRGLLLVEALTARWGTRWPATGGKTVWAALSL